MSEKAEAVLVLSDEVQQQLQTGMSVLDVVRGFVIEDADDADVVSGRRNDIKRQLAKVEEAYEDFVLAPIRQAREKGDKWFKEPREALKAADEHCRTLLSAWTVKEQQRIAQERAEAEAQARKARQEAEAKAAAERARAEEQAREAQRQAREAEERRLKAVAEGNTRAAAAAAAEAAKQAEKAQAALSVGAAKAEEAMLSVPSAAPVTEMRKIAGTDIRMKWVAELVPDVGEEKAKELIAAAVAGGRTELLALLDLNMRAVDRLAEGLHERMNVPGFKAKQVPVTAKARAA